MPNPYSLRPVHGPAYFVPGRGGRGDLAQSLLGKLRTSATPDPVSVVGERRSGKTSLLKYLESSLTTAPGLVVVGINLLSLSPQTREGFYTMLTSGLIQAQALPEGHASLDYNAFVKFLRKLPDAGKRLILLIDEFDVVARVRAFDTTFFDNLRALADSPDLPFTLVVGSVVPLREIAHGGVYGSPFWNIFYKQRLGLLSRAEAQALVSSPPGGEPGLPDHVEPILALAGRYPFFLQLACSLAWDLREASGQLDLAALRDRFLAAAEDQYRSMWEHSTPEERQVLRGLADGGSPGGAGLNSLVDRGYAVIDEVGSRIGSDSLAEFIRRLPPEPAAASAPPRGGGPATVPPALPRMKVNTAAPVRRRALVAGVNVYRTAAKGNYVLNPLEYAERDAEEIARLLELIGFEVVSLLGDRATLDAITKEFDKLEAATAADPNPDDCFIFHFSGHGQMDPGQEDTAYLVLHDTDPTEPAKTGLEMSRLVYTLLPRVRVPNSLVLLDSCHAGFAAGVRDLRMPHVNLSNVLGQLWARLRGRMVLAACAAGALARELRTLRHGVFSYYVLLHWRDQDGFHPPECITFSTLLDYVGATMKQNHPDLPLPTWSGSGEGPTLILRRLTWPPGPPESIEAPPKPRLRLVFQRIRRFWQSFIRS
jgi:hypothetical protein